MTVCRRSLPAMTAGSVLSVTPACRQTVPTPAASATIPAGGPAGRAAAERLEDTYRFERGGWVFVHLQGTPAQVGVHHGRLLAAETEDLLRAVKPFLREDGAAGIPEWDWGPDHPGGTVQAKVMDAAGAASLEFRAAVGRPCAPDVQAEAFLAARPAYAWMRGLVRDMPGGPWTRFAAGMTEGSR
jgi:hypothetical protein